MPRRPIRRRNLHTEPVPPLDVNSSSETITEFDPMDIETPELLDETWISATSTYNYMMKDPLCDWLKHHYNPLTQKHTHPNNSVLENYNFTTHIMEQGKTFERKVMKLLHNKFTAARIEEINGEEGPRNPKKVEETLAAMKKGVPIIHSGVLHNHKNKTFGIPDLLVRSDWLKFLVKEAPLTKAFEIKKAKHLPGKWHYRVVDIKFTGLLLRADATHLLNAASFPAYKAQLLIYNWALGQLQGYTPNQVYILGRRWKYTAKGETHVNNSCVDRFGIIDYNGCDDDYVAQTKKAIEWLKEVRTPAAAKWNITEYPLHRWELYPNMCNTHDYPWRAVKEQLADQTKELTNLWMVGPKNRHVALEAGVCQWTDEKCTPAILGITGDKTSKILSAIININQSDTVKISPEYITNNIGRWKKPDAIEFFVDFENQNGAISKIKNLPKANTNNLVFLIGVGYIDPDTKLWVYKDFCADRLKFDDETKICHEFTDFIREKAQQYGVKQPRCIHWAPAEDVIWSDILDRHDPIAEEWKSWMWNWLDLLTVFKEEPIVINGCMSFSLKDVAVTMKQHGFIKTSWNQDSICIDGQSAMIAAYKADHIAQERGISMKDVPIMEHIIEYNKVDVRVLYEIITYLRSYHLYQNPSTKRKRATEEIELEEPTPKRRKGNSQNDDI